MIAIIGVLASLLLPALRQARKQGERATCVSNLHQMAASAAMFSGDYDGYPPPPHVYRWQYWVGEEGRWHCSSPSVDASNNVVGRVWWMWPGTGFQGRNFANILLMGGYMQGDRVFDCPSFLGASLPKPSNINRTNLAYGMNKDMCSMQGSLYLGQDPNTVPEYQQYFAKYHTVKFGVAREPARSILFCDRVMVLGAHWTDGAYIGWRESWGMSPWNNPGVVGDTAIWYHDSGLNITTYDGSVHWVTRQEAYRVHLGTGDFVANVQPAPAAPFGRPMW